MTGAAAARPEWLRPKTRAELGEGEGEAHGGSGKWCRPGVPHKGWVCADPIDDVGGDVEVCEMCETAEVRYVHVMTNPRWEGELRVGCVCAGRMMEDLAGAQLREADFKRSHRQSARVAEQAKRAERCLTWVRAADQILGAHSRSLGEGRPDTMSFVEAKKKGWGPRLLDWEEENFVHFVRGRMAHAARPRVRNRFRISEEQQACFKMIYERVVKRKAG